MTEHRSEIDLALQRSLEFFRNRKTRAGVIARRILGMPAETDAGLTEQLIGERRRRTRMDGGVGGWVMATTWSAWELLQLGCPPDHTGVIRMIGYLLSRQDAPGRFGEGCADARHEIGHCNHFLSGFFSPATRDHAVAPLTLPTGAVFTEEWEARFAASCFALRTVLHARQDRRDAVRRHIESLLYLEQRWASGDVQPSGNVVFSAFGALAMAPLQYRPRVEALGVRLAQSQEPDGGWPDTSFFHALETMLLLSLPDTRAAVKRATPRLLACQRPDGAFDDTANEDIALIALRAIKSLGQSQAVPRPPRVGIRSPLPHR